MIFLSVLQKELKIEFKSRYSLNAALLFALVSVSAILFSFHENSPSLQLMVGIYWVLVFFSSMASLSRAFVYEIERGSDYTLKTLTSASNVFVGKFLFNHLLTLGISFFIFILFLFFFDSYKVNNFNYFMFEVLLGSLGISITSTFISSIIAYAKNKNSLYSILCFPAQIPLIVSLIKLNEEIFSANFNNDDIVFYFLIIISYCGISFIISIFLFELIWED
jgi:heme exporter protein B